MKEINFENWKKENIPQKNGFEELTEREAKILLGEMFGLQEITNETLRGMRQEIDRIKIALKENTESNKVLSEIINEQLKQEIKKRKEQIKNGKL